MPLPLALKHATKKIPCVQLAKVPIWLQPTESTESCVLGIARTSHSNLATNAAHQLMQWRLGCQARNGKHEHLAPSKEYHGAWYGMMPEDSISVNDWSFGKVLQQYPWMSTRHLRLWSHSLADVIRHLMYRMSPQTADCANCGSTKIQLSLRTLKLFRGIQSNITKLPTVGCKEEI